MASLADNYAAAQDPRVIGAVTAAIYAEATNVYNEATTVTGHTTRAAFAHQISQGTVNLNPLILSAVCFASLTALSTGPTSDTNINNAVASLWNQWAGV